MRLSDLKKKVNPEQLSVLRELWAYYRGKYQWIPAGALYKKLGIDGQEIARILSPLGGDVVFSSGDSRKRYVLTFLGVLLADEENIVGSMVARYLAYVCELYISDCEVEHVNLAEAAAALGLDGEARQFFEDVVMRLSLYSGGGGQTGLPVGVDDLVPVPDLMKYAENRAAESFNADVPMEGTRGWGFSMGNVHCWIPQARLAGRRLTVPISGLPPSLTAIPVRITSRICSAS